MQNVTHGLTGIACYIHSFDLRVVKQGFFAVGTATGTTRDPLTVVRQSVGGRVMAIDLASSIAKLFGQGDSAFDVLSPDAGPESIR